MKLGILGASDIAFRRFLPALQKCDFFTYAGTASRTPAKAAAFQARFGGRLYPSYEALLEDQEVGAVYVPLPPALHEQWGRRVLEAGKHLLMEKPFTTCLEETEALLALAQQQGLAVHENYMFLYHSQLRKIRTLLSEGALGEIRLVQASFGFPKRGEDDFRYKRALGGGALLDCGGYPVRLALELLGGTAQAVQAKLVQPEGYEVDLYGSAVLENADGLCAQISFGMDNAYQCRLEIWGSKATLIAPRIFTAGTDVQPPLILRSSTGEEQTLLEADDQFFHSLEHFWTLVEQPGHRVCAAESIRNQAATVQKIVEDSL